MNILQTLVVGAALLFYPTPATASTTATTTPITREEIPAVLERIAWCESHNNPTAKNKYSTASGRFQFLWGSWHYYGLQLWGDDFYNKNVWDYDDNTELAVYVYKKNGTSDWSASKSCWSPTKDV